MACTSMKYVVLKCLQRILVAGRAYYAVKIRMVHLYFNLSQIEFGSQQKMLSKTLTILCLEKIAPGYIHSVS